MKRQEHQNSERSHLVGKGMLLFLAIGFFQMVGEGRGRAGEPTHDPAITIVVNETATVKAELIRLEDIALIHTDNASLRETLGRIEIGDAPKPGFEKRLTGRSVQSMIRPEGIDRTHLRIDAPETILVRRASQAVPEDRLLSLFQIYLENLHPDGEVVVSQFKVRGSNLFPRGVLELTPVPDTKKALGVRTLSVNVSVDGKTEGTVVLSGRADIYKNVVCAKTYLERGSTLSIEDVYLKSLNISKAPADVLTRMEDVFGRQVTVSLREGAFLRGKMLETPPMIEKGDKVKLVAEKGVLSIETVGIAKTSGAEGAQIQVKNLSSGKVVVGRVKDASTVLVLF